MDLVSAASPASISGEVVVTQGDVTRALAQLPLFRWRRAYLVMALLLVGVLLALGRVSLSALAPFLGFTAVFQAFLFLFPLWIARRTVAAMPDRTMRYRADASEITIETTGSTVTRSWNRITQFREEKTAFLIWIGPQAVQVIPKRAFSAEHADWLRETLRREVKTSRRRGLNLVVLWAVLVLMFLILWLFLDSAGGKR